MLAALRGVGLTPRGAFHPRPEDGVPDMVSGCTTRTVVLAGNAGPLMWQRFAAERERAAVRAEAGSQTLDQWSAGVLKPIAARFGARAVFPFDRPYLPFQRWAQRAEPCHPSPIGMLVHPDYGLWHGYRGALLLAQALELPVMAVRPSPCDTCVGRPCLSACPVGAFATDRYDVPRCVQFLSGSPEPDCMDRGCRARLACPVGGDYRYTPEQARFHMTAFRANHAPGELTDRSPR